MEPNDTELKTYYEDPVIKWPALFLIVNGKLKLSTVLKTSKKLYDVIIFEM